MTDKGINEILEEIEKLREEIQDLKNDNNSGGRQEKWPIRTESGAPTETTAEVLRAIKQGNRSDGLKKGQLDTILRNQGIKYSDPSLRKKMRQMESEFSKAYLKERTGANGFELFWKD